MTTQETIDDANAKLAAAQSAYDSALSNQQVALSSMQAWYDLTSQCGGIGSVSIGNKFNRDACHHIYNGPCQSVSTCKGNVDSYNATVDTYNSAVSNTTSKKTLLDAAVVYKNQVIENAKDDPTFIAQQQNASNAAILAQKRIDAEKAATRNKIIGAVVVIVVIVAAVYIWKKYF